MTEVDIVIPTLNAATTLSDTLATLEGRSVIVSDGGSTDATLDVARDHGVEVVTGAKGRGAQIALGCASATAEWCLILHADTRLSAGWGAAVDRHVAEHPDKAAYGTLALRASGVAPRIIASGANLRSRWLGLPYGDQGLLISRILLSQVGGYPEHPLMEDVEMARRLRGRLRPLGAVAATSADRYERDGWLRRALHNLSILARYKMGASPEDLVRRY